MHLGDAKSNFWVSIKPLNYIIFDNQESSEHGRDDATVAKCKISVEPTATESNYWVLGAPFLHAYYTVFDIDS